MDFNGFFVFKNLCILLNFLNFGQIQSYDTKKLSSGYDIPVIGLGTWQMSPEEIDGSVTSALNNGYRHIDTAFGYGNEEAIGNSLKKWFDKGNKREDLFITTKLPPDGNNPKNVEKYLNESLRRLRLNYVDLYLIHKPFSIINNESTFDAAVDADGNVILDYEVNPLLTWKEMENQVKNGKTRSIGLSNFNESQVLDIINNSEIKPSNLQIELHAYNQQKSIRELCKKNNITVTGYSTLGSPGTPEKKKTSTALSLPKLLDHPVIKKISEKHNKTPAQVLLRHSIQNDIIIIPKSTKPERIKSNIEIFDFSLTNDEIKEINDLDKGEDGRIFTFLNVKGVEKHPNYPFTYHVKETK